MKVCITGHSTGIGAAFFDHYRTRDNEVLGFSRSNSYDISLDHDRQRIISESIDADIFINNAYDFKSMTNFQLLLLKDMVKNWYDQNKVIINISSTAGDFPSHNNHYNINKHNLDQYINKYSLARKSLYILNVKPWYTDVERMKSVVVQKPKLTCQDVVDAVLKVLDLRSLVFITSLTIYPKL